MAEIGKLTAKIEADVTNFNKGLYTAGDKLDKFEKSANNSGKSIGGFTQGVSGAGGAMLGTIAGVAGLSLGLAGAKDMADRSINTYLEYEDRMASMRKNIDLTAEEAEKFKEAFVKMETPTKTTELMDLAIMAGKLGIAKDDVIGYTKSINNLNIALGDQFGGAEDMSDQIGTLANIMKGVPAETMSEKVMRIGNALNTLEKSGIATASGITDFSNRIAGTSGQFNLSAAEIMGLSAALQGMGLTAERGGSNVGRLLTALADQGAFTEFAQVLGVTAGEYEKMFNEDRIGTAVALAEKFQDMGLTATELSNKLEGLGINGSGTIEVFNKLGEGANEVRTQIGFANEALQNTDGIMKEVGVQMETTGSKLDEANKRIEDSSARIGESLAPVWADIVTGVADALDEVTQFSDTVSRISESAYSAWDTDVLEIYKKAVGDIGVEMDDVEKIFDDETKKMLMNQTNLQDGMNILKQRTEDFIIQSRGIDESTGKIKELSEEVKNQAIEKLKSLTTEFKDTGFIGEKAFIDVKNELKLTDEEFQSLLEQTSKDIFSDRTIEEQINKLNMINNAIAGIGNKWVETRAKMDLNKLESEMEQLNTADFLRMRTGERALLDTKIKATQGLLTENELRKTSAPVQQKALSGVKEAVAKTINFNNVNINNGQDVNNLISRIGANL